MRQENGRGHRQRQGLMDGMASHASITIKEVDWEPLDGDGSHALLLRLAEFFAVDVYLAPWDSTYPLTVLVSFRASNGEARQCRERM